MGFLRLVMLTSVCIGAARADVYQPIGYDPCVCTPGVHVQGYVHAPIQFAAPPFITMQPSYALATPMMSVDYSARPNLMAFPVPNDSLPPGVALPGERFVPVPAEHQCQEQPPILMSRPRLPPASPIPMVQLIQSPSTTMARWSRNH